MRQAAGKFDPSDRMMSHRRQQRGLWGDAWRRMRRNKLAMVGLVITGFMLLTAIFGPILIPYTYYEQDLYRTFELPSRDHLLGTDELGRDYLARVVYGARTAVGIAVSVTALSVLIGTLLGAFGAYLGGWVDVVVMRLVDVISSIPMILLAILIDSTLKRPLELAVHDLYIHLQWPILRNVSHASYFLTFAGLALIFWPGCARLVRGQILSIRELDYVSAARSVGANQTQIVLRHILPNAIGPIIVLMTFGFSGAIMLEAGLSFLGVGIQPPLPSWGSMLFNAMRFWRDYPWMPTVPAVVLGMTTVSINFLGDGLNDALNPRQAGS